MYLFLPLLCRLLIMSLYTMCYIQFSRLVNCVVNCVDIFNCETLLNLLLRLLISNKILILISLNLNNFLSTQIWDLRYLDKNLFRPLILIWSPSLWFIIFIAMATEKTIKIPQFSDMLKEYQDDVNSKIPYLKSLSDEIHHHLCDLFSVGYTISTKFREKML